MEVVTVTIGNSPATTSTTTGSLTTTGNSNNIEEVSSAIKAFCSFVIVLVSLALVI